MLSDEVLAEIEAAVAKATPPPWAQDTLVIDEDGHAFPLVDHEGCAIWPWGSRDDMDFAYAAREWVPLLLAEVRRLKDSDPRGGERL